jgi:hypothetical protein
MTETEWQFSDNAGLMIECLWDRYGVSRRAMDLRFGGDMRNIVRSPEGGVEFDRALHRFYLASCRGVWELLPQEASRRGVELAEQFLEGAVSAEKISEYNWHVEAAAFCLDYNTDAEAIKRWVADVCAIPESKLQSMLHPPEAAREIEPMDLLKRAAYFADYAMIYASLSPKGPPPVSYHIFLSAETLRKFVDYPISTIL